MIKPNQEWTQPVRPRDFWIAVLVVCVLLGSMGTYEIVTGHLPALGETGAILLLNGYWAFIVYVAARSGRGWRAYSWRQWVIFLAGSLMMGHYILPNSFLALDLVQNMALLAFLVGALPAFFTYKREEQAEKATSEKVGAVPDVSTNSQRL